MTSNKLTVYNIGYTKDKRYSNFLFSKLVLLRITLKNNLICKLLLFWRKKEKAEKMDNKLFNRQDYCVCWMAEAEGGVVGSCFFHVSAPRNHLFATPRRPEHNYNLKLVSFLIWTTWTSNSTPFTCVQQDNGNSRFHLMVEFVRRDFKIPLNKECPSHSGIH